ncbi:signal transduction protein with nacht domain protein [Leptolyngbya sp. Heron Island J]|uniref:NACHT domain-containing protein n=1 Tax=Leptolyngbya sp. Heron Island J TaxID=1385935 RepID=UPI0003B9D4CB|nr:NACHT domain-containing protein [Leptolyngbya sp. Heron Island J]ESA37509.1 signal transduction protein with nacht domain protein [Leptolyngbya sp. Heron Island J]
MCALPAFLTLRPDFCKKFKERAIERFGQAYIAGLCQEILNDYEIDISRDTVPRILAGRRGRSRNVKAICDCFDVLWQDACITSDLLQSNDIDTLVQRIRSKVEFRFEYGHLTSSSQHQRQWVQDNFIEPDLVKVEFLPSEYPVGDPQALLESEDSRDDDFDRLGVRLLRGQKTTSRQVLDDHRNIFVYGEPGSGKSSYLQWIALKCCEGLILQEYVPIFLEIRQFTTTNCAGTLLTFFEEMFERWGFSTGETRRILESGRAVFIFDGLDETLNSERARIESMIESLLRDYDKCRYIFSSRLAISFPYFGGFQKVILAPLRPRRHIPEFVRRWFAQSGKQPEMANLMLEKLQSKRYQGIRELARRPVLLKLLCIVFEIEGDFPTRRGAVFESGISKLTRTTADLETHIPSIPKLQDHHIYSILCRVSSYFFINLKTQILFATRDVERIIQDYFSEVHGINRDGVPGDTILRGIEQSNGLLVRWSQDFCAFSHLTYQEFFTAAHLVKTSAYTNVYEHLHDSRWHFVTGLVAELIPQEVSWNFFLGFKQTIDSQISQDVKLREFLENLNRTATFSAYSVNSERSHLQTYIRAWYFAYALQDTGQVTNLGNLYTYFDLPDFEFATSMITGQVLEGHEHLYKAYHCLLKKEPSLKKLISLFKKLKAFLSSNPQKTEVLEGWLVQIKKEQAELTTADEWWQQKRNAWAKRVAIFMQGLGVPNIFELTQEQAKQLRAYYDVTKLLSICMNRSHLDKQQRKQLADSMLLLTTLPPEDPMEFSRFSA